MINARKRIVETTTMFAVPIVALFMLDDVSIREAKTFPKYICFAMLLLATINLAQLWVYLNKVRPLDWPTFLRWSLPFKGGAPFPIRRVCLTLGFMTAYIFTMETIGFYLAGFLFFFAILFTLDPAKPTAAGALRKVSYAACFMFVVYVLFSVMLGVVIPSGIVL